MSLLETVKTDLRISHTALDSNIQTTINSCKLDLKLAGVFCIKEDDALIIQAVKLYCRANIGNSKDSEKHQKAYDSLKIALSLCEDYTKESESDVQ